jgi:hypothetical protein
MSELLTKTLLGDMPLAPADKLFKCPSGYFFKCRGIARAVPIKVDKIKVHMDFHIFSILDFDLLIGSPFEKFLQEKSCQGSLNNEFEKKCFHHSYLLHKNSNGEASSHP